MRTFRVLLAGWLIGGAVIVLLTVMQSSRAVALPVVPGSNVEANAMSDGDVDSNPEVDFEPAERQPGLPRLKTDAATAGLHRDVVVPVAGISASDLRDNYLQLRGGGTRTHGAIDIMAPRGTPVIAAVDGTIRKIFTSAAGGLTVYQFDRNEERVYYYAHLDSYAPGLHEGQFLEQGAIIGTVGTTGNAQPDSPHLHFAIEVLPPTKEWWKGTPINPYPVLTNSPVSAPR